MTEMGANQPPRAGASDVRSRPQRTYASAWMSTDARLQEHGIGKIILSRPRRTPRPSALPRPHTPTRAGGDTTLSPDAPEGECARYTYGSLNRSLSSPCHGRCQGGKADGTATYIVNQSPDCSKAKAAR